MDMTSVCHRYCRQGNICPFCLVVCWQVKDWENLIQILKKCVNQEEYLSLTVSGKIQYWCERLASVEGQILKPWGRNNPKKI